MSLRFWKNEHGDETLDRAVSLWRSALGSSHDHLSAPVRQRILQQAFDAREEAPTPIGVRSAAWRVLGGAVPVAVAVLLVLVFAERTGERNGAGHVRVTAAKTGAEVVFSIRNGHRAHAVYKSSFPNSFEGSARLPVRNGSFRDSMDDGSGLVFYRID